MGANGAAKACYYGFLHGSSCQRLRKITGAEQALDGFAQRRTGHGCSSATVMLRRLVFLQPTSLWRLSAHSSSARRKKGNAKAEMLAPRTQLDHLKDRPATRPAGGEQQRLASGPRDDLRLRPAFSGRANPGKVSTHASHPCHEDLMFKGRAKAPRIVMSPIDTGTGPQAGRRFNLPDGGKVARNRQRRTYFGQPEIRRRRKAWVGGGLLCQR